MSNIVLIISLLFFSFGQQQRIQFFEDMEDCNDVEERTDKNKHPHVVIKNTSDYQRMKLEKLMKNPVSHKIITKNLV